MSPIADHANRNLPVPGPRRTRPNVCALGTIFYLIAAGSALADAPVTITGGADVSGHNYEWTITNHHTSPIVLIRFPHYMADAFIPPEGWTSEMTNPLGKGLCSIESSGGLPTGHSVTVGLRVAPRGAFRGSGDVLVRFADDTEAIVSAQLPTKEPFIRRNVPVIGLGLAFGVFLLVRGLRKRKAPPLSSNGEP